MWALFCMTILPPIIKYQHGYQIRHQSCSLGLLMCYARSQITKLITSPMANPFFSGRIPPSLAEKIDAYLFTTDETRSELLIRLLRAEFGDNKPDNDNKSNNNNKTDNIIADLLQRVTKLEQAIIDNKGNNNNKADNIIADIKVKQARASRKKPVAETSIAK